jgi:hypothetical protein
VKGFFPPIFCFFREGFLQNRRLPDHLLRDGGRRIRSIQDQWGKTFISFRDSAWINPPENWRRIHVGFQILARNTRFLKRRRKSIEQIYNNLARRSSSRTASSTPIVSIGDSQVLLTDTSTTGSRRSISFRSEIASTWYVSVNVSRNAV